MRGTRWLGLMLLLLSTSTGWAEEIRTDCRPSIGGYDYGWNCRSSSYEDPFLATLHRIQQQRQQAQPTIIYVPVQPPPSPAPPNDGRLLLDQGFFRLDPIRQHRALVHQGAKVCPTCVLLYPFTMRYCPHDGAALKFVADYQEGALGQIVTRK